MCDLPNRKHALGSQSRNALHVNRIEFQFPQYCNISIHKSSVNPPIIGCAMIAWWFCDVRNDTGRFQENSFWKSQSLLLFPFEMNLHSHYLSRIVHNDSERCLERISRIVFLLANTSRREVKTTNSNWHPPRTQYFRCLHNLLLDSHVSLCFWGLYFEVQTEENSKVVLTFFESFTLFPEKLRQLVYLSYSP